jgi:magnesium chelatase subunit I
VSTPTDIAARIDIVRRRDAYERDTTAFVQRWQPEDAILRQRILAARALLPEVEMADAVLEQAARLCMALGTDGLRAELTLLRAARAVAALEGERAVTATHLREVAPSALRHRLRRDPLDESGSTTRVTRAMGDIFADA